MCSEDIEIEYDEEELEAGPPYGKLAGPSGQQVAQICSVLFTTSSARWQNCDGSRWGHVAETHWHPGSWLSAIDGLEIARLCVKQVLL